MNENLKLEASSVDLEVWMYMVSRDKPTSCDYIGTTFKVCAYEMLEYLNGMVILLKNIMTSRYFYAFILSGFT